MHRKPKTPGASAAAPITPDQRDDVPMTRKESDTRLDDEVENYVGELVDGKRHGHGSGRWLDGKQYIGQWQNGNRHGQGMGTWKDGQQYVGEWQHDLATGKAILSQPDGSVYAGEFLDSQRHGLGTQTYPNDATYTGEWKDNHPDGWGVIRAADGRQTIGRLEINRRHGRGVQFFANGEDDDNNRIYWEGGELISQSEWFTREQSEEFVSKTRRMGIPFCGDGKLSPQEKIYILTELADGSILDLTGIFDLAMMSIGHIHKIEIMNADISSPDGLAGLLALGPERIAAFCKDRDLPNEICERLVLWAEWSQSEERSRIERFLLTNFIDRDEEDNGETGFADFEK